MVQKWDQEPKTTYKDNLHSIGVEVVCAPSLWDLCEYIPQFVDATWAESPYQEFECASDKLKMVRKAFVGETLPTALETINLTFRITGISLQEVTHILRHRNASFSADCSGDKWWSEKDALVPNSVLQSDEFLNRYAQIVEDAKQLYCDMIDSRKISIMDARYILPRCLETFYYMRMTFKDCIAFIRQRIDKQIQPETDNVIAYLMWREILKLYPIAYGIVNVHGASGFYMKMARSGRATNLYQPDVDSDQFEWNERDFLYQCKRDELNGTNENAHNVFNIVAQAIWDDIDRLEQDGKEMMERCS